MRVDFGVALGGKRDLGVDFGGLGAPGTGAGAGADEQP